MKEIQKNRKGGGKKRGSNLKWVAGSSLQSFDQVSFDETPEEAEKRRQREGRFGLPNGEKNSFGPSPNRFTRTPDDNSDEEFPWSRRGKKASALDDHPLVGELQKMCSNEEILTRQQTRQLDRFEIQVDPASTGATPDAPTADPSKMVKKYQRSSADKHYMGKDIRSTTACWSTVEYLFTEILTLDETPQPKKFIFGNQTVPYLQIYSFIRDRIRAVRVDLHVQQPFSTTTKEYIQTHEVALRFELLSFFLAQQGVGAGKTAKSPPTRGRGAAPAVSTETYDEKMAMKAISQTIEPLLGAYKIVREKLSNSAGGGAAAAALSSGIVSKSSPSSKNVVLKRRPGATASSPKKGSSEQEPLFLSPKEAVVRRYIVLLTLSNPSKLAEMLAKMPEECLTDPTLGEALKVAAAYQSGDYVGFFKFYRTCDFLSAVCLAKVVGGFFDPSPGGGEGRPLFARFASRDKAPTRRCTRSRIWSWRCTEDQTIAFVLVVVRNDECRGGMIISENYKQVLLVCVV